MWYSGFMSGTINNLIIKPGYPGFIHSRWMANSTKFLYVFKRRSNCDNSFSAKVELSSTVKLRYLLEYSFTKLIS